MPPGSGNEQHKTQWHQPQPPAQGHRFVVYPVNGRADGKELPQRNCNACSGDQRDEQRQSPSRPAACPEQRSDDSQESTRGQGCLSSPLGAQGCVPGKAQDEVGRRGHNEGQPGGPNRQQRCGPGRQPRAPPADGQRQAETGRWRRQVKQFAGYGHRSGTHFWQELDELGQVKAGDDQRRRNVIHPRPPVANDSQRQGSESEKESPPRLDKRSFRAFAIHRCMLMDRR